MELLDSKDAKRATLRDELRQRRAGLSAQERIAAAGALVAALEQIPELLTDKRIAGYWAVSGELPLMALLQGLRERGQTYHLPVVGPKRSLRFAPWKPGAEIATNRFGIPEPVVPASELLEPTQIDVVLLPLLGFDRRGYRLGFGGGYYDTSFAFLRERREVGSPLLIGVGYALQEVASIEPMPWDVRLDYIATEHELIELAPAAEASP